MRIDDFNKSKHKEDQQRIQETAKTYLLMAITLFVGGAVIWALPDLADWWDTVILPWIMGYGN